MLTTSTLHKIIIATQRNREDNKNKLNQGKVLCENRKYM